MNSTELLTHTIEAAGGKQWQRSPILHLKGSAHFTPFGQTDDQHYGYFDRCEWSRHFGSDEEVPKGKEQQIRFELMDNEQPFFILNTKDNSSPISLSQSAHTYQEYLKWSKDWELDWLRMANRSGFNRQLLTEDIVEKYHCYFLKITSPNHQERLFGIDQYTYRIRYQGWRTPVGYHHLIYDEFVQLPHTSFIQPSKLKIYFDGIKWMEIKWKDVEIK
ncbi:MAG: hypothetical protein AAFP19_15750 [Bacteroidota bacterium]